MSRAAVSGSMERQQTGAIAIKALSSTGADEESTRTSFSSASYIARTAVDGQGLGLRQGLRERKPGKSVVPVPPPRDTLYGAYQSRPPRERTPPRNQLATYDARSPYAQPLSPSRLKPDKDKEKENTKNSNGGSGSTGTSTGKTRSSSRSSSSSAKGKGSGSVVGSKPPRAQSDSESPLVQLERELAAAKEQHLEEQLRYATEQHAQDARFHEAFSALKARPITRESSPVTVTVTSGDRRGGSSSAGSAGSRSGSGGSGSGARRALPPGAGVDLAAGGGSLLGDFVDDALVSEPAAAAAVSTTKDCARLPPAAVKPAVKIAEAAGVGVDAMAMAALRRALNMAEAEQQAEPAPAPASAVPEDLEQPQQTEIDSLPTAPGEGSSRVGGNIDVTVAVENTPESAASLGGEALHALLSGQWRGILRQQLEEDPDLQALMPVMHVARSPGSAIAVRAPAASASASASPGSAAPVKAAQETLSPADTTPATALLVPAGSESSESKRREDGRAHKAEKALLHKLAANARSATLSNVVTPNATQLSSDDGSGSEKKRRSPGGGSSGSKSEASVVLHAVNDLHIPVRKALMMSVGLGAPSTHAAASAVHTAEAAAAHPSRHESPEESPSMLSSYQAETSEISPVLGAKHKHQHRSSRSATVHDGVTLPSADAIKAEAVSAAMLVAAEAVETAASVHAAALEQTAAAVLAQSAAALEQTTIMVLAQNQAFHKEVKESAVAAARGCVSDITASATRAAVLAAKEALKDGSVAVLEVAVNAAREAAVEAAKESAAELLGALRAETTELLSARRTETNADVREMALKLRDMNRRFDGFVDEVFQQLAHLRHQQQLGAAAVCAVATEVRHLKQEQFQTTNAVAEVRAAVEVVRGPRCTAVAVSAAFAAASSEKERIRREIDTRFAALEAMEALVSKAEAELDAEEDEEVLAIAKEDFPVLPFEAGDVSEDHAEAEADSLAEMSFITDAASEVAVVEAETETEVVADVPASAIAAEDIALELGHSDSARPDGTALYGCMFVCLFLVLLSSKQVRAVAMSAASTAYSFLVRLHSIALAATGHARASLSFTGGAAELLHTLQANGAEAYRRMWRTQLGKAIMHKVQGLDPEL